MKKLILILAVAAFVLSPLVVEQAEARGASQLLPRPSVQSNDVAKSAKPHAKKHHSKKKHSKKHKKHHKKHHKKS